jgi:fumarate reductase flavoprotein subunit
MEFAHWRTNPRLVRAYMDKSGETIQWLENKGLEFECVPFYPNQIPTWHVARRQGAEIVEQLVQDCKRLGIKILTDTPVKKILTGSGGKITGVVAISGKEEIKIESARVILATGGYGGNKELLSRYSPYYRENMECVGIAHTGDGLVMAMEIGAATDGLGLIAIAGPQVPGSVSLKIGIAPKTQAVPLMAIALEPNTVWVNKKGRRFVDESASAHHFMLSNAVNRQPDNISYTLLDSQLVRDQTEKGLIIGMGQSEEIAKQRTRMQGLARALQEQKDSGWLKVADSWDEIARWIGADPVILNQTIDEYNTQCDRGHDPVFAKDRNFLRPLRVAPYYAIKGNSDILDTLGGIKINERMEVLDKQDEPIPGLYAAGVVAGGWESETYCDKLSGHTSGFALNSGRIAGENAAMPITGK